MKNIFLLALVFLFLSCKTQNNTQNEQAINTYEVYKIDSINSYYLIYVKQQNNLFKIISKKRINNCNEIKVNSFYKFHLISYGLSAPVTGDAKWTPVNSNEFKNCIELDDSTKVCKERYMNDLYYSDDIIGLCLLKK